jgi:ATP adenylyltransferase
LESFANLRNWPRQRLNRMTFDQLKQFISEGMRLSHIYQPLLIRLLVDADGTATVRSLAQSLLLQDESQIRYYEKTLKDMPLRVLSKHGVLSRNGELVNLELPKLTLEEKAAIRRLCEEKMQSFIESRGLAIWDHRLLETDPVPNSVRYQVLKAAGGKCALCGISAKDAVLHVDHIQPRSRGGTNSIENLQCLCEQCNLGKSNRDDTDFRSS